MRTRCDQTPAWALLKSAFETTGQTFDVRDAFADDPQRFDGFSQDGFGLGSEIADNGNEFVGLFGHDILDWNEIEFTGT